MKHDPGEWRKTLRDTLSAPGFEDIAKHSVVLEQIVENLLKSQASQYENRMKEMVQKAREDIINQVESTIAEFGDQGMETVASILQEYFHGQPEVLY